jgi:hypothetical protein
VTIISGAHARVKQIEVDGVGPAELTAAFGAPPGGLA